MHAPHLVPRIVRVIVYVVLGIVVALALLVGGVLCAFDRSREACWRHDVAVGELQEIQGLGAHRLVSSRACPTDIPNRGQPDPWGHPYIVECDGVVVRARSAGPDGELDTEDDLDGNTAFCSRRRMWGG